jgi:hypothetical protein
MTTMLCAAAQVYPRPNGEIYICGLGGSDYVDAPRLKAGGDCESPELIHVRDRILDYHAHPLYVIYIDCLPLSYTT